MISARDFFVIIMVWTVTTMSIVALIAGLLSRRLSFHWMWWGSWVGWYLDIPEQTLYICPLPAILLKYKLKEPR